MEIIIMAYTRQGGELCLALKEGLLDRGYSCEGYLFHKYENSRLKSFVNAEELIGMAFADRHALIMVCAVGIAVRKISGFVKSKETDAPVVVLDDMGKFSIPLLSGHLGGANALARLCAELTGGIPVITTATDLHGRFAVDLFAKENGLFITDMDRAKQVSADLLDGKKIYLYAENVCFRNESRDSDVIVTDEREQALDGGIIISVRTCENGSALQLISRQVTLGIGCRRGTSKEQIAEAVRETLSEHGISFAAVKQVCSIDLKQNEAGLTAFCEESGLLFQTFDSGTLRKASGSFAHSSFVEEVAGVDNVCERSAVAGSGGTLLIRKTIHGRVTVAAALEVADVWFDANAKNRRSILLFAGTTEGKQVIDLLETLGIACYVSVATAYGRQVLDGAYQNCQVLVGRMDAGQIADFLRGNQIALVIDATHPYAVEVTKNAKDACQLCGVEYLRVVRQQGKRLKEAVYCSDMEQAAQVLCQHEGNVLLTTGSKDLAVFTRIPDFQNRVYARILPLEQSVQSALCAGYCREHLICEKGPFSKQQNMDLLKQCNARFLVTKDSGDAGGFLAKAQAAQALGISLLVVERPWETGITIAQLEQYLRESALSKAEAAKTEETKCCQES